MIKTLYRDAVAALSFRLLSIADRRAPDFVVGHQPTPYLERWWLFGGRPHPTKPGKRLSRMVLGVRPYLHQFLRSDDDRAHHDHPSPSVSVCLAGSCVEVTIAAGGIEHRRVIKAGTIRFRSAKFAHRLEVVPGQSCWTLFVFGPGKREWGFHCPKRGWVHWEEFTDPDDSGLLGAGCGDES